MIRKEVKQLVINALSKSNMDTYERQLLKRVIPEAILTAIHEWLEGKRKKEKKDYKHWVVDDEGNRIGYFKVDGYSLNDKIYNSLIDSLQSEIKGETEKKGEGR